MVDGNMASASLVCRMNKVLSAREPSFTSVMKHILDPTISDERARAEEHYAHFKLYIFTRGRSLDTPPVRAHGAAAHARARSCGVAGAKRPDSRSRFDSPRLGWVCATWRKPCDTHRGTHRVSHIDVRDV
jgi:hypothetical protein